MKNMQIYKLKCQFKRSFLWEILNQMFLRKVPASLNWVDKTLAPSLETFFVLIPSKFTFPYRKYLKQLFPPLLFFSNFFNCFFIPPLRIRNHFFFFFCQKHFGQAYKGVADRSHEQMSSWEPCCELEGVTTLSCSAPFHALLIKDHPHWCAHWTVCMNTSYMVQLQGEPVILVQTNDEQNKWSWFLLKTNEGAPAQVVWVDGEGSSLWQGKYSK